jgi:hypothetical protein
MQQHMMQPSMLMQQQHPMVHHLMMQSAQGQQLGMQATQRQYTMSMGHMMGPRFF